ncbi:MAG TPA: hypothetical protein VGJ73_10965 [Verrucomicrobiae bacterium]|jgi:hypothetical protein
MKDTQLHLEIYLPAAGASETIGSMDIGIDNPNFSDQWRQGRLRIAWPALPNFTSNADSISVTLQDSAASSNPLAFANTVPLIQANIAGVASTGPAAGFVDCPLPPGLRGPIQLLIAATANAGNNTAALLTADWLLE